MKTKSQNPSKAIKHLESSGSSDLGRDGVGGEGWRVTTDTTELVLHLSRDLRRNIECLLMSLL